MLKFPIKATKNMKDLIHFLMKFIKTNYKIPNHNNSSQIIQILEAFIIISKKINWLKYP